jgi:hypothetical protein
MNLSNLNTEKGLARYLYKKRHPKKYRERQHHLMLKRLPNVSNSQDAQAVYLLMIPPINSFERATPNDNSLIR